MSRNRSGSARKLLRRSGLFEPSPGLSSRLSRSIFGDSVEGSERPRYKHASPQLRLIAASLFAAILVLNIPGIITRNPAPYASHTFEQIGSLLQETPLAREVSDIVNERKRSSHE
jgi:hypothetical protein